MLSPVISVKPNNALLSRIESRGKPIDYLDTDAEELLMTVNQVMPFGRFKGCKLIELPEPYLVWFHNQGFPDGSLGRRMAVMYEIKVNGLESMLEPLTRLR